jgi:hypothetical protein
VRWREELEEPLFVKRSSLNLDLVRGEKNIKNREKRGSHDSVAVRAHIVKRHFILIQS